MPEKNKMEIAHVSKEIGIAETIIKKDGKTIFAVCKDGKVEYKKSITLPDGTTITPPNGDSNIIKNKFITLPPEPIDYLFEEDLFNEVKSFINRYFITSKEFSEIATLYVMLTWIYECFEDLPYLRVIGTLGTGKSRFLKTLGACTYNSMKFGSSSVAAMFRTIDQIKGTFILDEADYQNSEFSSSVAKILNNGNTKDMPVARMRDKANSKGEYTTDFFQVFGPKILASRESFDDTALESRCFVQKLYPNKNIKAPVSLGSSFLEESKILRGKLLNFRYQNYWSINVRELRSDKITNSRIIQITQPIWNMALLINKNLAKNVINEAVFLDRNLVSSQTDTQEVEVLIAIMKLMDLPSKKIHMKLIAKKYNRYFGSGSYVDDYEHEVPVFDYKTDLKDRKIGEIVGKNLHLNKLRDNKGVYILKDKTTKLILKNLCNRYGITDDLIH